MLYTDTDHMALQIKPGVSGSVKPTIHSKSTINVSKGSLCEGHDARTRVSRRLQCVCCANESAVGAVFEMQTLITP